jgi:predicted SnoaL-like aldol condensation-catalyzing enzyme
MKKTIVLLAVATALLTACETSNNKAEGTDTKMADSTNVESAESKTERNKKVVRASMEAMMSKNVDEAFKDVAPDVVDYNDGSMPAMKGKDSIMNMIKSWMNAFPDNKGNDLKYVAEGDWVMVWGEWSGTFKNDFMGTKATNKSYKMKDVDIFKLNDAGQIIEHHNVQSPNTMMRQVGMAPPKK